MSLYVNTTLVGCIAFIMIFTYTSEYVFFSDQSSLDMEKNIGSYPVISFDSWYSHYWNYIKSYELVDDPYVDVERQQTIIPQLINLRDGVFQDTLTYGIRIMDKYESYYFLHNIANRIVFDVPVLDFGSLYDSHFDSYKFYLKQVGYSVTDSGDLVKAQKNLFDNAMDFFGSIGSGVGKFGELVTFQIKNSYGDNIIPSSVAIILNMFFIPMWIILAIELIPLLSKVIEAIGSLIPF